MGSEGFGATDELLLLGAGAARDGDREQARFYLEWVLRDDPSTAQFAQAWYWLSRATDDPEERRRCLGQVLGAEPLHAEARRDLAILDGRLRQEEIVDHRAPVVPLSTGGAVATQEVQRHRCPTCGGALTFNTARQGLVCQFCGYSRAIGTAGGARTETPRATQPQEQDWEAAIHTARGHRWVLPGERMLTCGACGAAQTLQPGRVSALCAFCGSAQVIEEAARADLIAPEGIVPFAFDAVEARRRIHGLLAKRRSWRDDDQRQATSGTPRPVYLPFWTFDIEGEVRWRGYVEQRNARVPKQGSEHIFFDDLLVPAGGSLPGELLTTLTYDTRALVAYSPDLLVGWPAELYRVPVADASLLAREQAVHRAKDRVYLTAEGELHDLTVSSIGLAVVSYKLVLLPVWVVTYRDADGEHQLAISGQAGAGQQEASRGSLGRLLAWVTGDEGGFA